MNYVRSIRVYDALFRLGSLRHNDVFVYSYMLAGVNSPSEQYCAVLPSICRDLGLSRNVVCRSISALQSCNLITAQPIKRGRFVDFSISFNTEVVPSLRYYTLLFLDMISPLTCSALDAYIFGVAYRHSCGKPVPVNLSKFTYSCFYTHSENCLSHVRKLVELGLIKCRWIDAAHTNFYLLANYQIALNICAKSATNMNSIQRQLGNNSASIEIHQRATLVDSSKYKNQEKK